MNVSPDYTRWVGVSRESPRWDERNALIASLIPRGASVLDLGAGARTLAGHLSDSSRYQAVDLVPGPGVVVCNFDTDELPRFEDRFDIAVVSGVLEYLADVEGFVSSLGSVADAAVLTYAVRTTGDTHALRAARGWVNHLRRHEMMALLEATDCPWTVLGEWRWQVIFGLALRPSASLLTAPRPQTADAWMRGFEILAAWTERVDNADVPPDERVDDFELGAWVDAQREAWADRRLEPTRAGMLNRLPGWIWSRDDLQWRARFAVYAAIEPGHLIPADLRRWAADQRAQRHEGELAVDRAAALAAIPGWTWDPERAAWEDAAAALRHFATSRGHCVLPDEHVEDGIALGAWLAEQRSAYAAGSLHRWQVATLEAILPRIWEAAAARWERGLSAARAFVERNGHAWMPAGTRSEGIDVAAWLDGQRAASAQGWLTDERRRALDELGVLLLDDEARPWEERYAALVAFADESRHASPALEARTGELDIGAWAAEQRALRSRGELAPARVRRLERLAGWAWTDPDARWERGFARLARFAEARGHASPDSAVGSLSDWVEDQRRAHAAGALAGGRAARLAALPGWSWTHADAAWERDFAVLAAGVETHGHALVAVEAEPALRRFVRTTRLDHGAGLLAPERVARLEGLRGWSWEPVSASFAKAVTALSTFTAREGHANVPAWHVENGTPLGAWVRRQAAADLAGTLAPAERMVLASFFGWARSVAGAGWATGYRDLVDGVRQVDTS